VSAHPSFARRLISRPTTLLALLWLAFIIAMALFPGHFTGYDPLDQDLLNVKQGPSADHWLGADALGRDLWSRIVWGAPDTLIGVVEALIVVAMIGVPLGLTAGLSGGLWDIIASQYVDVIQSLPTIVILLAVLAVFGQSMGPAMVTLGVLGSAGVARVVRSATIAVRGELYITAARLSGLGEIYILVNHVLPRVIGPVVVQLALFGAIAVLVQTGVAFLGLGVAPPAPTWGGLIYDAAASLSDFPWLLAPTGGIVALTILAFGLLGDGLRDASTERWARPAAFARRARFEPRPACDLPARAVLSARNVSIAAGDKVLVENVDFDLFAGETLGIVGESGSGKTLTMMALIGLLPPGVVALSGTVVVEGREIRLDDQRALKALRGGRIGLIFQDPMAALDPCFTIGHHLMEVADPSLSRAQRRHSIIEALRQVKINDPEDVARRYPHQISGGMAQRVGIARSLMKSPGILFADEPTTALDVTVQAEILDLMRATSRERKMAVVMVTHDWGVVADICDRAMVMRHGRALESADVYDIFERPQHPYTRALLAANPHAAAPGSALPTVDEKLAMIEEFVP
jgi:peptide/nickel transport system permease protein